MAEAIERNIRFLPGTKEFGNFLFEGCFIFKFSFLSVSAEFDKMLSNFIISNLILPLLQISLARVNSYQIESE